MATPTYSKPMKLEQKEFEQLSSYIGEHYGIKLPPAKKSLLESRLAKRIRALHLPDFKAYVAHVFSDEGIRKELPLMIDLVTTNKTDFYREPRHFELLAEKLLPEWKAKRGQHEELKIWSAGCSSGMEVYTLAIVISEYGINRFQLVASDLSVQVLKHAVGAVYTEKQIEPVPDTLKRKYFLKSRDRNSPTVRVVSTLRNKATFYHLNLMADDYPMPTALPFIFCRNTLIYFKKADQEAIINKLCRHLLPGGYLFLGHSESIVNLNVPLVQCFPSVYKKQ